MPNTSKSANALAYCLGMDDVVHASIMLGRIRKSDNNTQQLHLYPWEISAWNGRPSGICPLMGKSDPNYTANKTMCVFLHEILFVPICHDIAQKFQVGVFCLKSESPDVFSRELKQKTQEMMLPATPTVSVSMPKTDNALASHSSSPNRSSLTMLMGYQYPSQSRMAADFLRRRWNSYKEPAGQSPTEQLDILKRVFKVNGAQCAQLCVANLLDVISLQQRHSGTINVSNYFVHEFRKLLNDNETSLHPQNVLETFAKANSGQPLVDCEMHVTPLFSRASAPDVELFWAYSRRILELSDVVVPDPWLQQPRLPHPFIV